MDLYYFPLSTYSQKVLIALKEKGLSAKLNIINMFNPEEKSAYINDVYPLGKIPLLVREDGWMIPESSIIVEYLDTHFDSGTQLIPADKELSRQTRFYDRVSDLYFNDAITTLLFQARREEADRIPEKIEAATFNLNCTYGYFNDILGKQTWLMGDNFSMADCAAIPALYYAQESAPFDEFENIVRYWQQAQERPSYKEVLEEAQPYLKDFGF